MKKLSYSFFVMAILGVISVACTPEGVKSSGKEDVVDTKPNNGKPGDKIVDSNAVNLQESHEVVDDMMLSNGVKIKWFKHGSGEIVEAGDMVDVNYRVELQNGELIDGNELRKMASFPYMVGFQMQPGWDAPMKELRIGDHVEIHIPYKLARGEKAVQGLLPEKADHYVKMQIIGLNEPDKELPGGTRLWMFAENKNNTELFGPGKNIYFHCYLSSPSAPMYFDTQVENNPFNYNYDDPGLVPGMRKALNNAKKADLMLVHVPAAEAYGNKGYHDIVKPNEDLFGRIFVMEVKDQPKQK